MTLAPRLKPMRLTGRWPFKERESNTHGKEQPQATAPFSAFTPLIGKMRRSSTCCLLLKTCARCFPTSAERFRQTHQGWSMTLAAASRDAGHVRAATIPARSNGVTHEHACETTANATSVLCVCYLRAPCT